MSSGIKVNKYGILTDSYRTADVPELKEFTNDLYHVEVKNYIPWLLSDHFPVTITVKL